MLRPESFYDNSTVVMVEASRSYPYLRPSLFVHLVYVAGARTETSVSVMVALFHLCLL